MLEEWETSPAIEYPEALAPSASGRSQAAKSGRTCLPAISDYTIETALRKQHTPEDLIRFWLGHANRSITGAYSKLHEDVAFRKKVAEQVGIGFDLPAEKLEVAPNCTSELLSTFA